ncbi:MAG: phosphatidylserine decarboxylase family protein [Panacibacter sp.]
MTIHREGYQSIGIAAFLFGLINVASFNLLSDILPWVAAAIFMVTLFFFLFIVSFFRIPKRKLTINESHVVCPADGKVVVIEEITDKEYFQDKRIQVSIFMSPANVHVNRNPIAGKVEYSKYHKGKYLVAWNPKSSEENERHSVVLANEKVTILVKQIAGALAKRISNYLVVGDDVEQGNEFGFIKFGSRVDVLLPVDAKINVQLNQAVQGGVTVLASF